MCVWLLSEYSLCCLCSLYCSRYELPLPPPRSTSLMLLSGWVGWLQGSFGGETNAHVVLCWWGRLLYRSEIQHSFSFYVFHSVRQTGWGRRVSNFFFDFSFFFHRPLFMFCSASLSFCPVGLSVQFVGVFIFASFFSVMVVVVGGCGSHRHLFFPTDLFSF